MKNTQISVIIPTHNEAQTIGNVVSEVKARNPEFEIIVVDDGSQDATASTAKQAGATVYRHPYNIGNGAAIKTGIRHASGGVFVFMDGDGQHNPSNIQSMLDNFPDYDMVVGARPLRQQASWGRAVGNNFCNWLASYVAKFRVRDLTSGFRAVKADIARRFVYLLPNTYSYPTTLTLGLLRNGMSLKYVQINVSKRQAGKSKINLFRDGIRFFMMIIKICTLYSPFRVFLPVSFFAFLLGLFYYAYTFFAWGRFTNMSALLFSTSVLIFLLGLISEQITQIKYEKSEDDGPS